MKLKSDGNGNVVSKHLFDDKKVVVFDKKSGDMLRTVSISQIQAAQQIDLFTEKELEEKPDPNQLKLF